MTTIELNRKQALAIIDLFEDLKYNLEPNQQLYKDRIDDKIKIIKSKLNQ